MQLSKVKENERLTVAIKGRVDTITAPELDEYLEKNTEGITELVLDLKDMIYTSSAGLRVIIKTQKRMRRQGSMKLIHVTRDVMEIFDITGFTEVLTIEE